VMIRCKLPTDSKPVLVGRDKIRRHYRLRLLVTSSTEMSTIKIVICS
jgi:hypothetical protein